MRGNFARRGRRCREMSRRTNVKIGKIEICRVMRVRVILRMVTGRQAGGAQVAASAICAYKEMKRSIFTLS